VRAILDTNVFVSGLFFTGPPHRILRAWRDGRVHLVLSPEILEEYRRVADELAADHPGVDLDPVLDLVVRHGEIVAATPLPEPVCTDPDDDRFLACAVASRTSVVVSGDRHLLAVTGWRGVSVLRPRDFVERHLGRP
jgi:putative PIN family toxin of toxin-antitoxin system